MILKLINLVDWDTYVLCIRGWKNTKAFSTALPLYFAFGTGGKLA